MMALAAASTTGLTTEMAANPAIVTEDMLRHVALDEVIVSTLKEDGQMRQQPISVTQLGSQQLRRHGVTQLWNLGTLAPNLFIPDYGSRQTSAIYMRGIGSRIGTPAVGLYVDNVPYYDKTAFDFMFLDVAGIDLLRGPQSTLYGRNAMGGLIRLHTRNPFEYTGTDIRLGWSSRDNKRQVSAAHFHRQSDALAFSASAFYEGDDGIYRNSSLDAKTGDARVAGARLRAIMKPSERWTVDAALSYEYSDENAYPYFYTGAVTGDEEYPDQIGKISANLNQTYRRELWNASLNAEYRTEHLILNSVTAWQGINDRMLMDQDFLAADIYSLEQRQDIHTLSEELVLKTNGEKRWRWLTGLNLYHQSMGIKAPVTFRQDGLTWLNSLIADKMKASPMPVKVEILGQQQAFLNDFDTPTIGAALFHQSTLTRLMGVEGLSATLGLRIDYEKRSLDYEAWYEMAHSYVMAPRIDEQYGLSNRIDGELEDRRLEWMPKVSLQYANEGGNFYLTMSRGYRSGGYNVQGISEPMQQMMQTDMMKNVRDVTLTKVPPAVAGMVSGVFDKIISDTPLDVDGTCSYQPEYAWNFEAGLHRDMLSHRLRLDASIYMSRVQNLQLSKMSESGLGRTVVNAGRSRALGAELSVRVRPVDALNVGLEVGLSNATFRDYSVIDDFGKEVDCRGKHVPFMPNHTINIDASYAFHLRGRQFKQLVIGADLADVGILWWDEQNLHEQNGYALLGAQLRLMMRNCDVTLWGRNLTQTSYDTFWFESMKRGYEQKGKPLQVGMTLNFHLQ